MRLCAEEANTVLEGDIKSNHFDMFGEDYENAISDRKSFLRLLKRNRRKRYRSEGKNNAGGLVAIWIKQDSNGRITAVNSNGGFICSLSEKSKIAEMESNLQEEFKDTLCAELPAGVPPVRYPGAELILEDGDPFQPPQKKVIRLTESQLAELRIQLQYYLEKGFLRPSNSAYATPVFFAPKRHTQPVKWRMCCDYRVLNSITRKDAYPLPAPDTVIDAMKGAKVFSKLDLTQYFHQIPVAEKSIPKTAITTRYGNYEWTVVPFGLHNSPAIAQRVANTIFREFIDDFLGIFMDDIIVYSNSVEEHYQHLRTLFETMRKWKLYAHPEKCEFFKDQLEYLGIGISAKGIRITDTSREAIAKWELPKPNQRNKKQNRKANIDGKTAIRTFIGMVSFFRKFIPRLTERIEPIAKLLQPEYSFDDWGDEQTKAWQNIKDYLISSDFLMIPDSSKPFVIYPDMSSVGIGGVLMQYDENNKLRPCAFMSSRLSAQQRKRGAYENELWAMIKCMQIWKHYIHRAPVEIRTDHSPLKHIQTQYKLTDKVIRWLDFLSEFDFKIVHVPREQNTAADGLSKTPSFYDAEPPDPDNILRMSDLWRTVSTSRRVQRLHVDTFRSRDIINAIV